VISAFNLLLIATAFLLDSLGIMLLALVLLALCLICTVILRYFVQRKESQVSDVAVVSQST